jgi:hypothetical protein
MRATISTPPPDVNGTTILIDRAACDHAELAAKSILRDAANSNPRHRDCDLGHFLVWGVPVALEQTEFAQRAFNFLELGPVCDLSPCRIRGGRYLQAGAGVFVEFVAQRPDRDAEYIHRRQHLRSRLLR